VLTSRTPGGFPNFKLAEVNDGWAALFVPATGGTGLDIVTSFNASIRIFRRENGGAVLDQELVNGGTGINSVSPAIVRLNDDGDGIGLATIDGDGDLLIARRGGDGRFAWREQIPLGPGYLSEIASADLDGDGRSEIAVLEAFGQVPSPTAALRDGFYRLRVLRQNAGGNYEAWREIGMAGQFPGNPAHLSGGIPLPGPVGGDYLWVSLNGRAWGISGAGPALSVGAVVDGVGDGPVAWGEVPRGPLSVGTWTVFPTAAGLAPPDGDLTAATLIGADGVLPLPDSGVIALVARHAGPGPAGERIRLEWAGGSVDGVARESLEPEGPAASWSLVPGATSFTDSTAVPDARYRYRLIASGFSAATLEVTVQPTNPIVESTWDGRRLILSWGRPIRSGESSRLIVVPVGGSPSGAPLPEAVASSLLDPDGRRLIVELAPGLEPGAPYRLELLGYRSASNLALAGADARADFVAVPAEDRTLRLVRVVGVDATTLVVELAPGAPLVPSASNFEIVEGPAVTGAVRETGTRVRLTLAAPLPGGDQQVRLGPGALGPGGETVRPGEGDVLPFRTAPVVFPNPARPGAAAVTFEWLPFPSRVTLRDLGGREIWSADTGAGGSATWPLRGADGAPVAPGIYLWQVEGSANFSGKLAVLR
jgi:hypothetical protein